MTSGTAPVSLADIQRPLRARLERVQLELRRIVEADFGLIAQVNAHLFQMQGKLFRPTLLLLADEATGTPDPRATTLAAIRISTNGLRKRRRNFAIADCVAELRNVLSP